jgi:hypothetical protein
LLSMASAMSSFRFAVLPSEIPRFLPAWDRHLNDSRFPFRGATHLASSGRRVRWSRAGGRDRRLSGLPACRSPGLERSIRRTGDGCQGERGTPEGTAGRFPRDSAAAGWHHDDGARESPWARPRGPGGIGHGRAAGSPLRRREDCPFPNRGQTARSVSTYLAFLCSFTQSANQTIITHTVGQIERDRRVRAMREAAGRMLGEGI